MSQLRQMGKCLWLMRQVTPHELEIICLPMYRTQASRQVRRAVWRAVGGSGACAPRQRIGARDGAGQGADAGSVSGLRLSVMLRQRLQRRLVAPQGPSRAGVLGRASEG